MHELQTKLIKHLALVNEARFNELLLENVSSEHMNYHLKRLIEDGYVKKDKSNYMLTYAGKNYASTLDDKFEQVEKQPKTSVALTAIRTNSTGELEQLFSKRLKQPYFGKVGRITGKIIFGETPLQAAERELFEETGLHAKTYILEQIYHKMRYTEQNEFIQDTYFYVFHVTDFYGTFVEKTDVQQNFWLTKKLAKNGNFDFFEGVNLEPSIKPRKFEYIEDIGQAVGY